MRFKQDATSGKYRKRVEDPTTRSGFRIEYSYVEINTLEELMEYVKKEKHPIIITESFDGEAQLETYDDYRE